MIIGSSVGLDVAVVVVLRLEDKLAGILPVPGLVGLGTIVSGIAFLNSVSIPMEFISAGPILVDPMVGVSVTLDVASKELDERLKGMNVSAHSHLGWWVCW